MYERYGRMKQMVENSFPMILGSLERGEQLFGQPWKSEFNEMLAAMYPGDAGMEKALDGYNEFSIESMRLHLEFQAAREYIRKPYDEVSIQVYQNDEYMFGQYLPGILLSSFLWLHHYRQLLFFREFFLKKIATADDQRFHDVGTGTGFYSMQVLRDFPGATGDGWDLSPHSLRHTRHMLSRFGLENRYTANRADITSTSGIELKPFLMSVEVLEHLEDPLAFLKGLHAMLAPGGYAFVTAAVNAPHEDHIYLYRNAEDVCRQAEQAGFWVEQYMSADAYRPQKRIPIVPSATAMILAK